MDDVLKYFRDMDKALKNEISNKEDEILVNNVFKELRGKEMRLACHHDGSRILENLISLFNQDQLQVLWEHLLENDGFKAIKLSSDRYGSHVMESLIKATNTTDNTNTNINTNSKEDRHIFEPRLLELLLISKREENEEESSSLPFSSPSLDTINQYSAHVIRVLLDKCNAKDNIINSITDKWFNQFQTMEIWEMAKSPIHGPLLQAIMDKLSHINMKNILFLDESETNNTSPSSSPSSPLSSYIHNAIFEKHSSYFIEYLVGKMESFELQLFYISFIKNNPSLKGIIQNEFSIFPLLKLIECSHSSLFGLILDDISSLLDSDNDGNDNDNLNLVESQKIGILLKLIHGSLNKKEIHKERLVKFIFDTFKVKTVEQKNMIIPLALGLQTFDQYKMNNLQMTISTPTTTIIKDLGCTLVSLLSKLGNQFIVNSFLKLTDLNSLCRHKSASHVMEAFFSRPEILSLKGINNIITKNLDISSLACDKYASHVVEKLWSSSSINMKNVIMEIMAKERKAIEDSTYGRLVWKKCKMNDWIHKKEEWNASEELKNKKQKCFEDILNDKTAFLLPSSLLSKDEKKRKKMMEEKEKDDNDNDNDNHDKEEKKKKKKKKKKFTKHLKTEEEKLLLTED